MELCLARQRQGFTVPVLFTNGTGKGAKAQTVIKDGKATAKYS